MESPEIYLITSALKFQYGILIGLTAWQSLLRLCFVFVNAKMKEGAENMIPADREWIDNILNSRKYRITVFLINMLLTIKLPEVARRGLGTNAVPEKKENNEP